MVITCYFFMYYIQFLFNIDKKIFNLLYIDFILHEKYNF
jgi:hypothetical protein